MCECTYRSKMVWFTIFCDTRVRWFLRQEYLSYHRLSSQSCWRGESCVCFLRRLQWKEAWFSYPIQHVLFAKPGGDKPEPRGNNSLVISWLADGKCRSLLTPDDGCAVAIATPQQSSIATPHAEGNKVFPAKSKYSKQQPQYLVTRNSFGKGTFLD